MALILGYVFVAIAVIVAFVISILIVKRLKDDHEKESLTTFLTILALALSLLVLLIVPIDIYSSKPSHNHDDSQVTNDVGTDPTNTLSTVIRYFYYGILSFFLSFFLFCFNTYPFIYFYFISDFLCVHPAYVHWASIRLLLLRGLRRRFIKAKPSIPRA